MKGENLMWYVCDNDFEFAFSEGFATKEEAEMELPKLQRRLKEEYNLDQNFIVLFIEG